MLQAKSALQQKIYDFAVKKRAFWPCPLSEKEGCDSLFIRTIRSCTSVGRGSENRDDKVTLMSAAVGGMAELCRRR